MPKPSRTNVVIIIFLAGLVGARLVRLGGDATAFMVAGEKFLVGDSPVAIKPMDPGGYDGQFFARIALSPFEPLTEKGIRLDLPAYRYQRILYPLGAWLIAFGQGDLVPYSLILLNLAALAGLALLLGYLEGGAKIRFPVGIAALLPGFLMALGRDLAEPLASLLVVAALYSFHRRQMGSYALIASLAVLTRETTLIVFAGVGIIVLWDSIKAKTPRAVGCAALPALVYLVWQLALFNIFGETGLLSGPRNFGPPLGGLLDYAAMIPSFDKKEVVVQGIYLGWIVTIAVYAAGSALRRFSDQLSRCMQVVWVIWSVLALCFSRMIWEDDWSFCRVLSDWLMVSLFLIWVSRERLPLPVVATTAVVILGTTARLLIKA